MTSANTPPESSAKFPWAPPVLYRVHNKLAPPTNFTDDRWFKGLRYGLMGYCLLAAGFFVLTGLNLVLRFIPRSSDSPTLWEVLPEQYYFMNRLVHEWMYVAAALSALGFVMNVFGIAAVYLRNIRLVFVYLLWSVGHVLMYAAVMGVTLILITKNASERTFPGTRVEDKTFGDHIASWVMLLTFLLPDFALWSLTRAAACFVTWLFYTELRNYKLELARYARETAPQPDGQGKDGPEFVMAA
ncbi:hypothetical protein H9P43_008728 [Blastocladiella emersonii ATCC 22665]|nr:hypothetical protein H9P43_008728 [Blastocladiella emersonii ATCC 22665]